MIHQQSVYTYIHLYVYIYTRTHIHTYIYISGIGVFVFNGRCFSLFARKWSGAACASNLQRLSPLSEHVPYRRRREAVGRIRSDGL